MNMVAVATVLSSSAITGALELFRSVRFLGPESTLMLCSRLY